VSPRTHHDELSAVGLDQADALGDVQGLADRVAVPGGAGAGGEVHHAHTEPRRLLAFCDHIHPDVPGEPLRRSLGRGLLLQDLHVTSHTSCWMWIWADGFWRESSRMVFAALAQRAGRVHCTGPTGVERKVSNRLGQFLDGQAVFRARSIWDLSWSVR
jgi:hypothetical protein